MADNPDVQDVEPDSETKSKPRPSAARKAISVVADQTADLIWDGENAYAVITEGGGVRTLAVGSAAFKRWVAGKLMELDGTVITGEALQTARLTLEAAAERGGIRPAPTIRAAAIGGGGALIDLGDDRWHCVRVTAEGWEVIPHPADGPFFYRPPRMAALPVPVRTEGIGVGRLWDYINIQRPEQRMLKLAGLLHKLQGRGPYVIEAFGGEQGSTKSTAMRVDKALTDPTRPNPDEFAPTSLRSPPRDERNLAAAARGARVLAFDNVSYIPQELADLLCRVATGADLGGRALYTDFDER